MYKYEALITNTNYFTEDDFKIVRFVDFKIFQLSFDLEDLVKRNKIWEEKGYSDLIQWLEDMVEYQTKIKKLGLIDIVFDANLSTEKNCTKVN